MERNECEKRADDVRIKYNPLNLSPFPYQNIEKDIPELTISFFPFAGEALESLSGVIVFDTTTNKFDISINESRPLNRQYFTLAHEIGHYFLHKEIVRTDGIIVDADFFDGGRALFREDNGTTSRLEKEANYFAAALLMPVTLVEKAWNDLKSVEECAKVFNVSVSAMSIRLEYLKLLSI